MRPVGMLVRTHTHAVPQPPEVWPVGRAALKLRAEGILVVFGDHLQAGALTGLCARPGGWDPVERSPILALHDRYPSQTWPQDYQRILDEAAGVPFGNPPAITVLCRDKIETQRYLMAQGLAMPAMECDPACFQQRLAEWGVAFLKPRFGALGRGIVHVMPGAPCPAVGPGAVAGVAEPMFLQRAVASPSGWAGCSARVLVQRLPGGAWVVPSRVLRRSRHDPVVNVARGAEVGDADSILPAANLAALDALCLRVAEVLSGHPTGRWLVELGVDAVLGADGRFHLIEVNSRPRGRLEVLAQADPQRYGPAHVEACARPFRTLESLCRQEEECTSGP